MNVTVEWPCPAQQTPFSREVMESGQAFTVWFKHGELLPKENQSLGILFYCLVGDIMSRASNLAIISSLLRHVCVCVCLLPLPVYFLTHHLSTSPPCHPSNRLCIYSLMNKLHETCIWFFFFFFVFLLVVVFLIN